jgi:hypothetical protein
VPLPTSRERTYAAGSQVFSADLNVIQDQIISLTTHLAALQSGTEILAGIEGQNQGGTAVPEAGARLSLSTLGTSAGAFWRVPITFGRRLVAIRAVVQDNATGPTKWNMQLGELIDTAGSVAMIGSSVLSTGAGTRQTIALAPNLILASGRVYMARLYIDAANISYVHRLEFDWSLS